MNPKFYENFLICIFSDKKINSQAALLRDYWQRVKNGEETSSTVSFVEYSNWSDFGSDFGDLVVDNDLIICIWRKSDPDISRMLLDRVVLMNRVNHSILFIFHDVNQYLDTIAYSKGNSKMALSRCSVVPVNFGVGKAEIVDNVLENATYGLLCGKYPVLETPLQRMYHKVENLVDLVKSICLPLGRVAMVSDIGSCLYRIHTPDLAQRVRYYGTQQAMSEFFKVLEREKSFPSHMNGNEVFEGRNSHVQEVVSASTEEVTDKLQDTSGSSSVTNETDTPSTSQIKCDVNASQDSCYGSQV